VAAGRNVFVVQFSRVNWLLVFAIAALRLRGGLAQLTGRPLVLQAPGNMDP